MNNPRPAESVRLSLEVLFIYSNPGRVILVPPALPKDCGIPEIVLEAHEGRPLILEFLDLRYFEKYDVSFGDDHFEMTLSFDGLYRCRIPYNAVVTIQIGFPAANDVVAEEAAPKPVVRPTRVPHLQLVE